MTSVVSPSGCMTPRTPPPVWSEKEEHVDAKIVTPSVQLKFLGSPAPVSRSLPTLPPTPPFYSIRPKIQARFAAKNHADKLKARLQLAYFRVKTNQIDVPLNEITI